MARQLHLSAMITVCRYNELTDNEKILVDKARAAVKGAYAPYSGFRVGAAIELADGRIITGSNQENGSYPEGLCAERVALFSAGAISHDTPPVLLAIAAENNGEEVVSPITPCGACRQVMRETELRYATPLRTLMCGAEDIYIAESAGDLLPLGFELPSH